MKFIIVLCLAIGAYAAPNDLYSWRIVGGQAAAEGQFPYQISLRRSGSHSCGGSIIDETTILCAAHCVEGANANSLTVVTGTNKLNSGGDTYKVASFKYHEDYDAWNIQNDVSILKLASPIKFNEKVQPVKLRQTEMPGDAEATLSGWGRTNYPGNIPNDLQFIKLKTLSVKECQEKQTSAPVIESEICTLTKAGEGACHGDSGGPLVDSNGEQIGIVSWGNPCARGKPDVFTRVTSFLKWIEANK